MSAGRRFRRALHRNGWNVNPPELAESGRILTPRERDDSVLLSRIAGASAEARGCTCDEVEVHVVEPEVGTMLAPGQVTISTVCHDDGCPALDTEGAS